MDKEKTARIRRLNDRFRRSGIGGDIFITPGIQELGEEGMKAVAAKVAGFDQFDHDNDPHGEHDFGAFDHDGLRIFWKMDYYSPDIMSGSEDPSDAEVTKRVLTIMLAAEYRYQPTSAMGQATSLAHLLGCKWSESRQSVFGGCLSKSDSSFSAQPLPQKRALQKGSFQTRLCFLV